MKPSANHWASIGLPLLSAVCIVYTHFRVIGICLVRWTLPDILRILTGTIFDILVVTLLWFILCKGHKHLAQFITYFIFLLWGVSNVIYATYFYAFMPVEVITQASELYSLSICTYISNALKWYDCIYVITTLAAIVLMWFHNRQRVTYSKPKYLKYMTGAIALCILYFISLKLFLYDNHLTIPNSKTVAQISLIPEKDRLCLNPVITIAQTGIIRGVVLPYFLHRQHHEPLTAEQRKRIDREWEQQQKRFSTPFTSAGKPYKNIVFIIAETYLASTANTRFGNKQVTPFLDKLRQQDNVCYNDSMHADAFLGNSSDGQFIYMTGLMPLRDQLTISQISNTSLITLPKMLKSQDFRCTMTIPTQPTLWRQDQLSGVYGIDNLYSTSDINQETWMNDHELFQLAESMSSGSERVLEFVLTVSTHGPYNEQKPETAKCHCYPDHFPADMSNDYKNYLLACHYMDHEIEQYFAFLKQHYDMDSTLIVIASDHGWRDEASLLPADVDKDRLSVLFVNVPKTNYQLSTISQIDVFTSLIDLLHTTQTIPDNHNIWYGLGNSIFRQHLSRPLTLSLSHPLTPSLSNDIIYGNYFSSY